MEKHLGLGILGCFGGLFIHLIIGAYFQWGFINVYITSYYRINDPSLTLESNGIVFPLMQLCIAPTMKIGHMVAAKIGIFKFLVIVEVIIAGIVLASSWIPNFTGNLIDYNSIHLCFRNGNWCFCWLNIFNPIDIV